MSTTGPPDLGPGDEAPQGSEASAPNACPECDGSGRAGDARCPSCGGTGVVEEAVGGG